MQNLVKVVLELREQCLDNAVAQDADQSTNGFEGGSSSGDADSDALEGKIISRAYTKVKEEFTISTFLIILIFQTNGFTSQHREDSQ